MKAVLAVALALTGTVSSFAALAAQPATADRALTRAEVMADLALWRRAGLDKITQREAYDTQSAQYVQALSQYRQWRSGDAYRIELARQQNADGAQTGQ